MNRCLEILGEYREDKRNGWGTYNFATGASGAKYEGVVLVREILKLKIRQGNSEKESRMGGGCTVSGRGR